MEGISDQLPGPPADRPKEPPLRDPDRPEGAQGAGHYTNYTENSNITTAMQGPTDVGDQPSTNLGLAIVTYNADELDFHSLNKLIFWL